jgi:hypothetical protein
LEIEKAIELADAVIICLSSGSVKKEGHIQKELRTALNIALEKPDETIFMIPLRLDDCIVPRQLMEYHYQDYFPDVRIDRTYRMLYKSLESRAGKIGINVLEIKEYLREIKEKETIRKIAEKKALKRLEKEYEKQAYEKAKLEMEKRDLGDAREINSPKVEIENNFEPELGRVLLVFDDPDWLSMMKLVVATIGYIVDGAKSIEEMILKLEDARRKGNPYSIVITELIFYTGHNGIEVRHGKEIALFLKSNYSNVKCIVMTHNIAAEEILELRDEYNVAYVVEKAHVEISHIKQTLIKVVRGEIQKLVL